MTETEMVSLIVNERLREKLVNRAHKDFPKDTDKAEDWAQRTLVAGLKKVNEFADPVGVMAYLMEKITFIALKDKERTIERRKTLRGLPRYKAHKDPMRHIDYKVDLEKAISRTVGEQSLQAALWEIYYEKSTWEDVLADMPKTRNPEAWRKALMRSNAELKTELKRKGYRK